MSNQEFSKLVNPCGDFVNKNLPAGD